PVYDAQTGDGHRFIGADVKHAVGVPGVYAQVAGVANCWNPPDGDAFVNDQLPENRGYGEVPPAQQGIELDRVAVVCIGQRLAQVCVDIKAVPYFGNGDRRAAKAGQPCGRRAEQRDQKNYSCVFHRYFFLLYFLIFMLLHLSSAFFLRASTNVFLSGKAERAVETRQVFCWMPPGSTIWLGVYPQPILAALKR